ncbi:hypothetical protein UNPA324_05860 [Bradyrhizobium sp. UNPA324]|nr:hypothetical protein UNPA324_05860 [Bradyrhizobium sp. UNPA324]
MFLYCSCEERVVPQFEIGEKMTWLIQLGRSCGSVLRLIKHLKSGVQGVAKEASSDGATSHSSAGHEFNKHAVAARDQYARSQFDLNGSVHDAVSWYNIKVNDGGRENVFIGWASCIGSAGSIGHKNLQLPS